MAHRGVRDVLDDLLGLPGHVVAPDDGGALLLGPEQPIELRGERVMEIAYRFSLPA